MTEWARKVWLNLPLDGQGLRAPDDPDLRYLRTRAARQFWRRIPWYARPFGRAAARALWTIKCWTRVRRFSKVHRVAGLFSHCLAAGAYPYEARLWRVFFRSEAHPLPGRAAVAVLSRLGDWEEQQILTDKCAASERLAAGGIATPCLLALLARGAAVDLTGRIWTQPARLFIKPRRASGARGTFALDVFEGPVFRADGQIMAPKALAAELTALTAGDDVLVQERLESIPEFADMTQRDLPPVLRLTTAREPGGKAYLHGALLAIAAPGESRMNFVRGHLRVPIHVERGAKYGTMTAGVWFARPGEQFERLPWNGAPILGRPVPSWEAIVSNVMECADLFRKRPLINWDLIQTPIGPVILEGNSCGDWILTNLGDLAGLPAPPLPPLLRRWANEQACQPARSPLTSVRND